jgi:nucleotide-binding universal stress UspA family protein
LSPFAWYQQKVVEPARAKVNCAAASLKKCGLEAIAVLKGGHPCACITEHASEWAADLVVIGTNGTRSIKNFFLGGVARSVLRNAPCSVEIVRGDIKDPLMPPRMAKVFLATDGSNAALAAAQSIAARPWPADAEVRVVSVSETHLRATEPVFSEPEMSEYIQQQSHNSETAVTLAKEVIGQAGVKCSTEVLAGNPKAAIMERAADWCADLIVLGAHGRHAHHHLLTGTVCETVAMHSHCSVEVVRVRVG